MPEHATSMGIDVGHMEYRELAQAILPDYAAFAVGQAAMHTLAVRFGMPVISFTEMLRDPERARATMQFWRRGAGGTNPSLGLSFERSSRVRDSVGLDADVSAHETTFELPEHKPHGTSTVRASSSWSKQPGVHDMNCATISAPPSPAVSMPIVR